MYFYERQDAGKRLAKMLLPFKDEDVVVLALPRGGVVLGAEVARELAAPLGVVLVRKIGHPSYSEYAIGAVVEGEETLFDEGAIAPLDKQWLRQAEASARAVNARRHEYYYGTRLTPPETRGKTVILVDDGIATGLTMEAAVRAVRHQKPKQIIVAAPVAALESVEILRELADEIVILDSSASFLGSVGAHYESFEQVEDEEVRNLLWEANNALRQTTRKQA